MKKAGKKRGRKPKRCAAPVAEVDVPPMSDEDADGGHDGPAFDYKLVEPEILPNRLYNGWWKRKMCTVMAIRQVRDDDHKTHLDSRFTWWWCYLVPDNHGTWESVRMVRAASMRPASPLIMQALGLAGVLMYPWSAHTNGTNLFLKVLRATGSYRATQTLTNGEFAAFRVVDWKCAPRVQDELALLWESKTTSCHWVNAASLAKYAKEGV